jgi:hypothetical protein
MIRQAAAVLAQILGMKASGQYKEADEAIEGALEGLTGLPFNLISKLDDDSLRDHLRGPDGELDLNRLLVVADLTFESGELHAAQGRPAESAAAYLRALKYYLEAALAGEDFEPVRALPSLDEDEQALPLPAVPVEPLEAKVEKATVRLALESLAPEVLYDLFQFYDQENDYAKAAHIRAALKNALPGDATLFDHSNNS